jgi:hypothetical protein
VTPISAHSHPRSEGVARWLVMAAILLATAIGLSLKALADAGQPAQAIVPGSLALAAYAASLLCLVGSGRGRFFGMGRWQFGSWTLLWYCTAFGLATLTWAQPQTGTPAQISLTSVLRALWLVAVGMTLWTLGYLIGPGQPSRRLGNRAMAALSLRFAPEVRSPLAPWILYALGVSARIATGLTTGLFGYAGNVQSAFTTASGYQQILGVLSMCAPLAVAAAALQVYRERVPGARVTLAVLFVAELAFGAAAGGKQNFIVTIIAVAIPFTTARRRLPVGLLAFTVLVFLVIIIPFNQAYRSVIRSQSGTLSVSQAMRTAPEILDQTIASANVTGSVSSSVSLMLSRIREIDSPAIIIQRTPGEVGYRSPVELAEAPVASLIPRAVWSGKPIQDPGYQFSQTYYDLPPTMYTSSAITPVGDLYRHGGWIPVIVGMFIFGCGVRLLDDVIDVYGNPHAIFLVLLFFPSVVKQEDDWAGLVAGIPGILLVWILAVYLTFRRSNQASANLPLRDGQRHRRRIPCR